MSAGNDNTLEDPDTRCGFPLNYCCYKGTKRGLYCKPLQRFATPKWALAFLSFAGWLQGFTVHGLTRVVLTTLEKRFGLSSTQSAIIISCYDAASLLSLPIVTYFGGKGRKPLWIGWGIVIFATGCLIFTLPHFAAPRYTVITSRSEVALCGANVTVNKAESSLQNYKYLFMLGNLLNGVGSTAIFTLGMTYLDENVSQKSSSTYHAIYFALQSAVGPATGYVLGGLTLGLFTNIGESVKITNTSPSWVGAWWLGMIIASGLLFVSAVPLLMLPKRMPGGQDRDTSEREAEVQRSSADIFDSENPPKKSIKDLILTNSNLLRNAPLILTALAYAFDYGLIVGFSAYVPKYLEIMYGLTATQSSIVLGFVFVIGSTIGLITGGVVVTKAHLRVRGMMRFCFLTTLLALICSFGFLIRCPNTDFAGATVSYPGNAVVSSHDFSSPCNVHCHCTTDIYSPVCGKDSVTYFSPCFAGCTGNINQTFTSCSCISSAYKHLPTTRKGKCRAKACNGLPIFLCTFFVLMLFTVMSLTPTLQIILRIVPFDQRSVAVGFQWVFNRCIGFPFPIIVGRVLDFSCIVWSTKMGQTASCRLYSSNQMTLYLFLILLICKICTLSCYGLDQLLYKPVKSKPNSSASQETSPTLDT